MKTAADQLDRMDALVQKIARSELSGTLAEAQAILAERTQPDDGRFDKVHGVLSLNVIGLTDSAARRLTRDILAALDK